MIKRLMQAALAASVLVTLVGAQPAMASGGNDVTRRGVCSASSDWKLKLSPENGKIEVEYEVDSNKVGQTWNVKVFKNGNRTFRGTRTTKAPSGSFTVRLVTGNTAGSDTFKGKATNAATGETCVGSATI